MSRLQAFEKFTPTEFNIGSFSIISSFFFSLFNPTTSLNDALIYYILNYRSEKPARNSNIIQSYTFWWRPSLGGLSAPSCGNYLARQSWSCYTLLVTSRFFILSIECLGKELWIFSLPLLVFLNVVVFDVLARWKRSMAVLLGFFRWSDCI